MLIATSSGGLTFTVALAELLPRVAVIVTRPVLFEATGKSANRAPAGMLTVPGTEATVGSLEVSDIAVAAVGARDTVTRRVPGMPLGRVMLSGVMLVTSGGGPVTTIWLAALEVFTVAVTLAVPLATAFTGTRAESCPAGTITVSETVAIEGASLERAIAVSASWATFRVTVRLPVAPSCRGRGLGS